MIDQARQAEVNSSDGKRYVCLWEGCKVYGKKSCSKSWLEKHVPTHGGKFPFACIVSGCKQRFSSQVREDLRKLRESIPNEL